MASLSGRQISNTFKDILHVYDGTENQGLEGTAKRVFDGEGIGSPLWVSTSLLQVGTNQSNSDLKVHGDVSTKSIKFQKPTGGAEYTVFQSNDQGSLNVLCALNTKSSVKFQKSGYDDIVMDAQYSSMQRGDGTKGNLKLGDTEVVLQKGSTDLLTAKEDGTIRFQNISSGSEPTPTTGDLAIINGQLQIGV